VLDGRKIRAERSESERRRSIARYGADKTRLRNHGDGAHEEGSLRVAYRPPDFFAVAGTRWLAAAVRDNLTLVEAALST
jgi:hypothetical protein